MIAAFPLQWPAGWPRTPSYKRRDGRFTSFGHELSLIEGVGRVLGELEKLHVKRDDVVISTAIRTRIDGLPRSDQPKPDDPGVAVYWQTGKAETRVMAVDRYSEVAQNLGAIAATLEAMRSIERHGGAQILDRAFTGFEALPAPGSSKQWRDVLGLHPATVPTVESINAAYRRAASDAHPDKGGSHERMTELNRARDQALQAISSQSQ